MPISRDATPRSIRTSRRTWTACASSSSSFRFPAASAATARRRRPARSTRAANSGTACRTRLARPSTIPICSSTVVIGDGEAETGPLMGSLHSNKFLNPIRDGAVLPILHLNGYKIANPTISARISPEELHSLFVGFGWTPYLVEGDDPAVMHQQMAATLEECVTQIRSIQADARRERQLRTTALADDHPPHARRAGRLPRNSTVIVWKARGARTRSRSPTCVENPAHLQMLEAWMRRYQPEELFDAEGRLVPQLKELAPTGARRMSANPHANGGVLRIPLRLPDFGAYAVPVTTPGASRSAGHADPRSSSCATSCGTTWATSASSVPTKRRPTACRRSTTLARRRGSPDIRPEDADGGELAPDGRVMEMLSEHTLEGWAEGYVLTGRHAFFASYEAFFHIIDSMVNQHAKWLEKCKTEVKWRASDSVIESAGDVDRVAAGSQRLYAPGPRLPRCRHEQERGGHPHLSPARRELSAERGRSLFAKRRLRERHRRRQAAPSAVSGHRGRHQALRKGHRHLDLGQHGPERRARCRHRERGRCRHGGSAGRNRHPAREVPGFEDPVRQRGRSVQASAVNGASARVDRPRLRLRCSRATSRSSSRSTDIRRSFTSSRIAAPTTRTCTSAATRRKAASTRRWG